MIFLQEKNGIKIPNGVYLLTFNRVPKVDVLCFLSNCLLQVSCTNKYLP